MHDSKVEMKMEEEMKQVCTLLEILEGNAKAEMERNLESVDTKEMGEIVDMIKDLYEAKEKIAKACYYKVLMKDMEEEEEEREKSGGGRMRQEPMRMYFPVQGGGQYRDSSGQSGSESWRGGGFREGQSRDSMGRCDGGSDGGNSGGRSGSRRGDGGSHGGSSGGRRGFSFDEYMEAKEMCPGQEQEHKRVRMESLNRDLDELVDMGKEVVQDMSPEEKQMWKGKISKLLNL